MKKGDKLICIKTYDSKYLIKTYFYKNKIYSITDINYNNIEHYYNYEINDTLWFNYNIDGNFYIEEYFITLKNQRKHKLDKLNSI